MRWQDMAFSGRGRIGRRSFWIAFAAWVALAVAGFVGILLFVLLGYSIPVSGGAVYRTTLAFAVVAYVCLAFWTLVAIARKRLQDRNMYAWFLMALLVPVVGWLWLFWICGFQPGTVGINAYGVDPRAQDDR